MYYIQISHEIIFFLMGNTPFFPNHQKYNIEDVSQLYHNFHNYSIL